MCTRKAQGGYTLIELLVVMAIIVILVSLIVAVVLNVRENAQIAATGAAINVIVSALDAYRAEYHAFPPVYNDFTLEPGTLASGADTGASYLRRNEVLYQWLTERFDAVDKASAVGPFLTSEKIKYVGDLGSVSGQLEFADSWGEPLVFLMPGVDHTGEVDSQGNKIPAKDSTMLKQVGQFEESGDWDVDTGRYDLYSLGPNNIDDSKLATGTLATYDKNGDSGVWGASSTDYDAIKGTTGTGDDIGTWKFNVKKAGKD